MSLHAPPALPTRASPDEPAASPPSPCVRNCCLDDAEVCLGCGRTLAEILEWHQATAQRRGDILATSAARVQARVQRMGRGG